MAEVGSIHLRVSSLGNQPEILPDCLKKLQMLQKDSEEIKDMATPTPRDTPGPRTPSVILAQTLILLRHDAHQNRDFVITKSVI